MQNVIDSINTAAGLKLTSDPFSGGAVVPKRQLAKLLSLVDGSAEAARRSEIAFKAVATRRENARQAEMAAERRSNAAAQANQTRGAKGRRAAARKAWATRRANG